MPYVVYILECSDGSYYTGSAADLSQRLWQHERGNFDEVHEIVKTERKRKEERKRSTPR